MNYVLKTAQFDDFPEVTDFAREFSLFIKTDLPFVQAYVDLKPLEYIVFLLLKESPEFTIVRLDRVWNDHPLKIQCFGEKFTDQNSPLFSVNPLSQSNTQAFDHCQVQDRCNESQSLIEVDSLDQDFLMFNDTTEQQLMKDFDLFQQDARKSQASDVRLNQITQSTASRISQSQLLDKNYYAKESCNMKPSQVEVNSQLFGQFAFEQEIQNEDQDEDFQDEMMNVQEYRQQVYYDSLTQPRHQVLNRVRATSRNSAYDIQAYQLSQNDPRCLQTQRCANDEYFDQKVKPGSDNYFHPDDQYFIHQVEKMNFDSIEDLQDYAIPLLTKNRKAQIFEVRKAKKYIQIKCKVCKYFLLWFICEPDQKIALYRKVHTSHKLTQNKVQH
eukprot:403346569